MEWFREAFDEAYPLLYPARDAMEARAQLDFIPCVLPLEPGARILDLARGTRRHSLELIRRGFRPVSLDLSASLLRTGFERARASRLRYFAIQADMRTLPMRERFDAVLSIFTGFGYFRSRAEDLRVLREVARVLRDRGYFFLDTVNRHHVGDRLLPYDKRFVRGQRIRQWRWFDPRRERGEKLVLLTENGRKRRIRESVRCYSKRELEEMLQDCGLRPVAADGDFDARESNPESPRTILVATKVPNTTAAGFRT